MNLVRDLYPFILSDLERYAQMLFVAGPRQCGKTTLAKMILEKVKTGTYWNYDIPADRALLLKKSPFFEEVDRERDVKPLVVLDEIHKYPAWKNYLKGAFDRYREEFRFLITGSGRLDIFQKGGDSLAGRYLLYHLFPLTVNELSPRKRTLAEFLEIPDDLPQSKKESWTAWKSLETLSGFPEPFLGGAETFYRRWARTYQRQIIREEIRDLTQVRQIGQLETLAALLPGKVGGLLSINALREDLRVSFETVKSWIEIFEKFFLVFQIPPWSKKLTRAIQKEPKLYLYDWATLKDPGARFENMVALHLFRAVTLWSELGLGEFHLYFIRDRQKNEVDFLISREGDPFLLVEAKHNETEPAPSLLKMKRLLGVPGIQLVNLPNVSRKVTRGEDSILVVSADRWLCALP